MLRCDVESRSEFSLMTWDRGAGFMPVRVAPFSLFGGGRLSSMTQQRQLRTKLRYGLLLEIGIGVKEPQYFRWFRSLWSLVYCSQQRKKKETQDAAR